MQSEVGMIKQEQEFLEYRDLLQYGIKLGTAYSLVSQGRIPHIRLGKRFVRFSKKSILEWLKSHEVVANSRGLR
jgi:excisionase family DNA binding protein